MSTDCSIHALEPQTLNENIYRIGSTSVTQKLRKRAVSWNDLDLEDIIVFNSTRPPTDVGSCPEALGNCLKSLKIEPKSDEQSAKRNCQYEKCSTLSKDGNFFLPIKFPDYSGNCK
jgi:hypothetical protein